MSERRRAGVRQLLTTNESDKGGVTNFLPLPVNFCFPRREDIFFHNWEGEDFDALFTRLTREYVEANPRTFAANVDPAPAVQTLPTGPGKKDPITGFFS